MKKTNVLQFICPTGFYGAERWILALAKHLNRENITCHLAVSNEHPSQGLEMVNWFDKMGLQSHQLKMRGRFDPMVVTKLIRLIKKHNIDIIHTHGYKSDILGLLTARITGIKAISTPHGFENARDLKLQLFLRTGCLVLRYFDFVVPLSSQLQNDIVSLNVPPDKIRLVPNGVDLDEIERLSNGKDDSRSPKREKVIGYIGQLISRKNVIDLIITFNLLFTEHRNIRLCIIGDGPQRKWLESEASALPAASKIEFLGYRENRIRFMQDFDVICMTSNLEGIPRALMEAMAMGIPAVAYDIPGINELIEHGTNGFLAPLGDKLSLKGFIERLLFSVEIAGKISQNAKQDIKNKHSAERMAHNYETLYQELNGDN